jgi:Icc-related predicted phosphoesterase
VSANVKQHRPSGFPSSWTALTVLLVAVSCGCGPGSRGLSPYPEQFDPGATAPLAIAGDLQRTSKPERLFLGREQNDTERARLVRAIAGERPALVALLGDLVFGASSAKAWQEFDALCQPLREARIPVLVALGNHDYAGGEENDGGDAPRTHLERRFPQLGRSHWYARRLGQLGLIWLDSNRGELGASRWGEQVEWYAQELGEMEGDARCRGILVLVHHPPFTNSTVTGDEEHVQEAFLKKFFASPKALAMVSGHAHTYEHFLKRGKHFIVSGGGGGPRVKLLEGSNRRHRDLFAGPSPRPFHYLLLRPEAAGVRVEVKGFAKGATAVERIDAFVMVFPGRKES